MLIHLSLLEALEKYTPRLETLRHPNGGFKAWMDSPQLEDRVVLWMINAEILGWAVARWYPDEKYRWRKKHGKRVWTKISSNPRWVIGWFVDPNHRNAGIMHQLGAILTDDLEHIRVEPSHPGVTSVCTRAGWTCIRPGTKEPWSFGVWVKSNTQDCSKSLSEFPSDCLPLP